MSALLPATTLSAEDALAAIEPERRDFAVVLAEGKTPMAQLATMAKLSLASAYRWAKDPAVAAYVDAVGREIGVRAKRRLRTEVDGAISKLVAAQDDPEVTPTMLKATLEILDRAGVTKEEITRSGGGGGETVVQVNILNPVNPDAQDEQRERARRKREAQEMALEGTFVVS